MHFIKEVEKLILNFIAIEQKVRTLNNKPNQIETFNTALIELERFALPSMKNTFGVIYKEELFLDEIPEYAIDYESTTDNSQLMEFIQSINTNVNQRILFKITQIEAATAKIFMSFANPQGKTYGECMVVQKGRDGLQIVSKYFLSRKNELSYSWVFSTGIDCVTFGNETPISILKYETPQNDYQSLFFHNQDAL